MSPQTSLYILCGYFMILVLISHVTARGANSATFFTADKNSPWYIVAYGMIGASFSGVTFISVPGWVGTSQFSYLQMVLGYVLGYSIIASVLLPLYYKLNLVSIYSYLEERFGFWTYKSGAALFILSRTIGSALRMYIVVNVLQVFIFDHYGVPYWLTVIISIALVWIYTFRGGIKTVVWTDTFQTTFMLLAVGLTIYIICEEMKMPFNNAMETVQKSAYSKLFFWDGNEKTYFFKQFFSGMFIAIVMTGLDQDMMQKNLTCRNLQESQKNMMWFSITQLIVNVFFLLLGALLYLFADTKGIAHPANGDLLFPMLAKDYLGEYVPLVFVVGVIAAAYSSADSALTALTTSFCVDFLDFNKKKTGEASKRARRIQVHLIFSAIFAVIIIFVKYLNSENVISTVFTAASYTYGPLLGLFAFGLFTKRNVRDVVVPAVCVIAPLATFAIDFYSIDLFNGYKMGFEKLIVNGLLTASMLFVFSSEPKNETVVETK